MLPRRSMRFLDSTAQRFRKLFAQLSGSMEESTEQVLVFPPISQPEKTRKANYSLVEVSFNDCTVFQSAFPIFCDVRPIYKNKQ